MNGCNGRMGQVITGLVKQDETVEIVAGIDQYDGIKNDYPVYASIEDCEVEADAVIDFSNAAAVDDLLEACEKKGLPVVLCTTGLSEEQIAKVKKTSEKVQLTAQKSFNYNSDYTRNNNVFAVGLDINF
mgnify:CR=1 FL=1